MRNSKFFGLVLIFLLSSCAKSYDWVPPQTQTLNYFFYEEITPYSNCAPNCKWFEYYVFENGDLYYYGGEGLEVSGWRETNLGPEGFSKVLDVLETYKYQEFLPLYDYLETDCGNEFVPDMGGAIFELKTETTKQKVNWDNGCLASKDKVSIANLDRALRKMLPLEKWVGKDHYYWINDQKEKTFALKKPPEAGTEEKFIEETNYHFEKATVLSLSPFPPQSGILATYVTVTISTPTQEIWEIYYPFFSEKQGFPMVGDSCSGTVEAKKINGLTTGKDINPETLNLVLREMTCNGKTYPSPGFK